MFGCALLPLAPASATAASPSAAVLNPGHMSLYLVVPDGWTFGMHRWALARTLSIQSLNAAHMYPVTSDGFQG
jgi:hypothetical protein